MRTRVEITYRRGWEPMNDIVRRMDLGIEGVYVTETIEFTTSSKITDKLLEGYKKALKQLEKESDWTIEVEKILTGKINHKKEWKQ